MTITIYTNTITKRLEFVSRFIFEERFGLNCTLSDDWDTFRSVKPVSPAFGIQLEGKPGLSLSDSGILNEKGVSDDRRSWFIQESRKLEDIETTNWEEIDLFGLVFFLITGFERYLPFKGDLHGRFCSKDSVLFRLQKIRTPIVDQWIECFRLYLQTKSGQKIPNGEAHERFRSTIDVDFPYLLYGRKSIWRHIFLVKRLLKRDHSMQWRKMYSFKEEDPFNTYEFLKNLHRQARVRAHFFLLLASSITKFDRSAIFKTDIWKPLLKELNDWAEIGLHPSYYSVEKPDLREQELHKLQKFCSKQIVSQRQHFLRYSLPALYSELNSLGFESDNSISFPDEAGFPLGTCFSVNAFDLNENKTIPIRLYQVNCMDVTLKQYLGLTPNEGAELCNELVLQVAKYGGVFSLLWHNSSISAFNGWSGWKEAYQTIVMNASQKLR